MDDVSMMAINRGVTEKVKNNAALQALCKQQNTHFPKPPNIRVGTCFASKNGSLSLEAQTYCQNDVEATLFLHDLHSNMPDLTSRVTIANQLKIDFVVDTMPTSGRSTEAIAQGIVQQVRGTWSANGHKSSKKKC